MRHRFLCTSCAVLPRCERATIRSIVCQSEFPAQGKNLGIRNTIDPPLGVLGTKAENAIIEQELPVLTAIGAAAARQQTFHPVSIFFDLLIVVPDAVLDGNIQIAVFPAAVFQKLQQPPADLGTLFHGLVFVEGQCKVGVILSGQAIAVKRTAEIIAPEKEVPLTAPERRRLGILILITDEILGDGVHEGIHDRISCFSGHDQGLAFISHCMCTAVGFLLFFRIDELKAHGIEVL